MSEDNSLLQCRIAVIAVGRGVHHPQEWIRRRAKHVRGGVSSARATADIVSRQGDGLRGRSICSGCKVML